MERWDTDPLIAALSPVDCTNFEMMRRIGLTDVLALDVDFIGRGFNLLPAGQT